MAVIIILCTTETVKEVRVAAAGRRRKSLRIGANQSRLSSLPSSAEVLMCLFSVITVRSDGTKPGDCSLRFPFFIENNELLHKCGLPSASLPQMRQNPHRRACQDGYRLFQIGVFGEFETIDESLRTTQEGLQDSLDQLDQFERLLADLRDAHSDQVLPANSDCSAEGQSASCKTLPFVGGRQYFRWV